MSTCLACPSGRGKLFAIGCQCRAHKRCMSGLVEEALERRTLACPRCAGTQRFNSYYVTSALQKRIPLSRPLFYQRTGLVPWLDAGTAPDREHQELCWQRLVEEYAASAPDWVQRTLSNATRKRIKLYVPRPYVGTKWD